MSEPKWTAEQAAELFVEAILIGLEGADDDDTVRPKLLIEQLAETSGIRLVAEGYDELPELTVKETRENLLRLRADLARREPS